MTPARIVIVDDHPLLAAGLKAQLELTGAAVVHIDPAHSPESIVDAVCATRPDGVVVDLGLPFPGGGESLIRPLVDRGLRVVVLTGETDRGLLARCSVAGAAVVLSKTEPLDEIIEIIGRVCAGQTVRVRQRAELAHEHLRFADDRRRRSATFEGLTARERLVLAGLVAGRGPNLIAEQDYVSVQTVRTQVKSVLRKLGVSSQLEAVAMANDSGWSPEASCS